MIRGEIGVLERRSAAGAVIAVAWASLLAARPRQWTKNLLMFVALAFTLNLQAAPLLARVLAAFACFCALSSAGYLLNDVSDVEADRRHPTKRFRPIASGSLPVPLAYALGLGLAAGGVIGCLVLSPLLGYLALGYLVLTAVYTLRLKQMVLLDIFGIAAGFVVRAAAGAVAIDVPISPWLYSATMLGALLIALGKRRSEIQLLGDDASGHRRSLKGYSLELIDQLVLVIGSAAVMTYALYTFSAENLPRDHSMMLTIPIVLYGLFRYLLVLRSTDTGGAPEDLLFKDRPLLIAVAVWFALSVAILYAGARPAGI